MMAAVVREELGGFAVRAVTAVRGPGMIVSADELRAAAEEVVAAALRTGIEGVAAFVVGAFGDPGVEELRAVLSGAEAGPRSVQPGAEPVPVPVLVVGIGEAALLEAADTAFGVVTTTPELVEATAARVEALGLTDRCTGIRCTEGDPHELAGMPDVQRERLAAAVELCARRDGARQVVIGGGPLTEAAALLDGRCAVPLIVPVAAACRRVRRVLG
ncbi:hypothetical protein H9Y04_10015 [Streptomyces sp. TRM66268-LWL]|uniref:Hydantoin racemase n=2 Tax=Streptomyces polyasparticus TaxID=2767826 RepID=A0ABR7SD51_9ACTN|nr:hypothetical protein [Streptomyces polyasparticus]